MSRLGEQAVVTKLNAHIPGGLSRESSGLSQRSHLALVGCDLDGIQESLAANKGEQR